MFHEIMKMKDQGNNALKNGDLQHSVQCYTDCLELNMRCGLLLEHRDLATIFSNKSQAHNNMKNWENAFDDANTAIEIDPSFAKSYWRAAVALKNLNKYTEAIHLLLSGLRYVDDNANDNAQFVAEITRIVCIIQGMQSGGVDIVTEQFRAIRLSSAVWTSAVKKLEQNDKALHFLFLGGGGSHKTGEGGLATGCSTQTININNLSRRMLLQELENWGMKLIHQLIVHGADHTNLSLKDGDTPLHCALRFAMKNGWFTLLDYLFKTKYTEPQSCNLIDKSQLSLYHVVAKNSTPWELKALEILQQYKVNPCHVDEQNKTALSYVSTDHANVNQSIKMAMQSWEMQLHNATEESKEHRQSTLVQKSAAQNLPKQEAKNKVIQISGDIFQKMIKTTGGKEPKQAIRILAEFINEHRDKPRHSDEVDKCRSKIGRLIDQVNDIPPDIKCKDSAQAWKATLEDLANKKKWKSISMLIKRGGFAHEGRTICSNISISSFIESWRKGTDPNKKKFVEVLLEHGSPANGLDNEEPPLHWICKDYNGPQMSLSQREQNHDIILTLLKYDADPTKLSIEKGDSPFHAAFKIGLSERDVRQKLEMLTKLLERNSKKQTSSRVDPSCQDADGDTLFHLVIKQKDKKLSTNGAKLLSKYKVNPYLANNKGEVPLQIVEQSSSCYQYLLKAAKYHQEPVKCQLPSEKNDLATCQLPSPQIATDVNKDSDTQTHQDSTKVKAEPSVKPKVVHLKTTLSKDQMKREIKEMITEMKPKRLRLEEVKREQSRKTQDLPTTTKENYMDIDESNDLHGQESEEETSENRESEDEIDVEDSSIFDNLTWEVECTADVWKRLRDNRVQKSMKQRIIKKIKRLGDGDRTHELCKELKGLPQEKNMKLYEAKINKGGRILWELAIAFSPRCSEESSKRLGSDPESKSGSSASAVVGGRVYSQIIRIWDIVLQHDNLERTIETIVRSFERGRDSIIQKKLVGISNKIFNSGKAAEEHVPMLYSEKEDQSEEGTRSTISDNRKPEDFFPPASSKDNEYHIMKFYSVNSSLVNAILSESSVKVDFPFRETELEHAIINLKPDPPSSLLLMGRSGTGKTTCCLYRLWKSFVGYWEKSSLADNEPLLPRDENYKHQGGLSLEDTTREEESAAVGNSNKGRQSSDSEEVLDSLEATDQQDHLQECGIEDLDAGEKIMDHLHQIFVTKNGVLCSEVRRNFRDLNHACEFVPEYHTAEDTPMRIQDVPQKAYPMFLNSRQFLLMLDGSLHNPFFPRNDDGSLKRTIRGWDKDEGPLDFIPMFDDEDEETEDDRNEQDEGMTDEEDGYGEERPKTKTLPSDPRTEVTYEVFASDSFWNKVNKNKLPYHPSLVWMEIVSFIKGSVEAIHSENGQLSNEQYRELGKKRAQNFTGDRDEVYQMFKIYEHVKRQNNYFDETDLVCHIYRRMCDVQPLDWAIHQLYVDETQDFTQAELSLILRSCQDPNGLFLTGDTAQCIMRGIAFRFSDLRSLFHYASKSMMAIGKQSVVTVPKLYQLTHNYRSHEGILNLASSVVDLMHHFFRHSFDHMKRDQGLFNGPRPVLLESCSSSDLALLLRGNKRKTSEIEFGAHQVIIVANEEAKKNLPAELSLGLVLTIFEAKGLEFDDVLLYNFFKDSQADKEWRVVTNYEESSGEEKATHVSASSLQLVDVDDEDLTTKLRPLKFDPDKHKVLNSELKYLYTALTRARVNVWIFDEDNTKRAPIFEYFKKKHLVKVIRRPSSSVDSQEDPELDSMFVETSSKEDWSKQGDYFFANKLWHVAATCYRKAGNEKKELKAEAHSRAIEAQRLGGQAGKDEYIAAAHAFLKCEDLENLAARCLFNVKEYLLSAQLFEKVGEVLKAAKIYENRCKRYVDASRCYEHCGDVTKAIELLKNIGRHHLANEVLRRHEQKVSQPTENVKQTRFAETPESIAYKSADYHFRHNNYKKMIDALNYLPNVEDRATFLKERKLIDDAVAMLKENKKILEAAKLLRSHQRLEDAWKMLDSYVEYEQFAAECKIAKAKQLNLKLDESQKASAQTDDVDSKHNQETLRSVKPKLVETSAEAMLLLGTLMKDPNMLWKSIEGYQKCGNVCGELFAMHSYIAVTNQSVRLTRRLVTCLAKLFKLISATNKSETVEEKQLAAFCDAFYGIHGRGKNLKVNESEGARIVNCITTKVTRSTTWRSFAEQLFKKA